MYTLKHDSACTWYLHPISLQLQQRHEEIRRARKRASDAGHRERMRRIERYNAARRERKAASR